MTHLRTLSIAAIAAAFLLAGAANADAATIILAGWNNTDGTNGSSVEVFSPDEFAAGIAATATGQARSWSAQGSNDGFYGDSSFAAPTGGGDILRAQVGVELTITNSTGAAVELDAVHFDFWNGYDTGRSAPSWSVVSLNYVSGDLGIATGSIDSASGLTANVGNYADWYDFSWGLGGTAADRTLADGESATFQIVATKAAGDTGRNLSAVDNVAISGSPAAAIPEPASLAMGLAGVTLIAGRRRRA
jgi:MYXO-CTERM domain-containing protein